MPNYLSTDPNAGLETQYLSTDPNAGLDDELQQYGVDTTAPESLYNPADHPIAERAANSVVNYAKGMVPRSTDDALRMANIPTDWTDPSQLAEFAVPPLKFSDDQIRQAKQRYDQIQAASQTPDWSQERMDAGVGTALDLLQLGTLFKGGEHFSRGTETPAEGSESLRSQSLPESPSEIPASSRDRTQTRSSTPETTPVSESSQTPAGEGKYISTDPNAGEYQSSAPPLENQSTGNLERPEVPSESQDVQSNVGLRDETQTPQDIAEQSGQATGIAQRTYDAAGLDVEPGEGISWQDSVDRGRELLNNGTDPQMIARRVQRTGRLSGDDMAVLRAERERLFQQSSAAEQALRANPNDPNLQAAYNQARKAETDWVQNAVKPAQTEWHRMGMAQQGEAPVDASTFAGLRRMMLDQNGRDVKPAEVQSLDRRAQMVRNAQARSAQAIGELDAQVKRRSPRFTKIADSNQFRQFVNQIMKDNFPCG